MPQRIKSGRGDPSPTGKAQAVPFEKEPQALGTAEIPPVKKGCKNGLFLQPFVRILKTTVLSAVPKSFSHAQSRRGDDTLRDGAVCAAD